MRDVSKEKLAAARKAWLESAVALGREWSGKLSSRLQHEAIDVEFVDIQPEERRLPEYGIIKN